MTIVTFPPESTTSDDSEVSSQELQHPTPQRLQQRFDLDDAFSVHEDEDSTSLNFDPDTFLKDLQANDTIGVKDGSDDEREHAGDEAVDVQSAQEATYDSTDASISTLDIDPDEPHHSPATPPQASSSSQSMDSEVPPSTPPDDATTEIDSQFTNIALSPHSHSSPHSDGRTVEHAYPNVIIDASKAHITDLRARSPEIPPSVSQQTSDSVLTISEPSSDMRTPLPSAGGDSPHKPEPLSPTSARTPSTPMHGYMASSTGKVRSSGPSAFEKVVSRTRPPYLPPKQKDEDEKHNKEWEEMMQRSRLAGK